MGAYYMKNNLLGQKKLLKTGIFKKIPEHSYFLTVDWPKRGPIVFQFEFCVQIQNPLVIWDIFDPIWHDFKILIFLPPIIFKK